MNSKFTGVFFGSLLILLLLLTFAACDLGGNDNGNGNGNGSDNGDQDELEISIVPTDFSTIQAAINAAADGDIIMVLPGRYKENIDFNGKQIILRSATREELDEMEYEYPEEADDFDIVANTIIDADGSGRVVRIASGETRETVLQGFTITGANTSRTSYGGGLLISNAASPTIRNNVITANTSPYGGGAYVSGGSEPLFDENSFIGNIVTFGRGAGIFVLRDSNASITNNHFSGHVGGPAIQVGAVSNDDATASITGNTIIENNLAEASGTGGIFVTGATSSVTISGNTISDNIGPADYNAGGIAIRSGAQAVINNNIITNNSAVSGAGRAGGILVSSNDASATITNNTITGNTSTTGGGIMVSYASAAISGNNISNNFATSDTYGGGGIAAYAWGGDTNVSIEDNTISNNSAHRRGGGIYLGWAGVTALVANNIIENNQAGDHASAIGGAICFQGVQGDVATIYGNTITGNHSAWHGGGIYVSRDAELKTQGGDSWPRINYSPGSESSNSYEDNTHVDTEHGGENVFFQE